MTTIGAVRVSTDQQTEKYGPDRQRQDVRREAERAGLEITQWVEEAISGANDERAAENRYYELAREHPGVNVVFSHPNRVGRHVEVTVGIARRIHKLGGTVFVAGIGSLRDRRNWKEFLRDAVDSENEWGNLVYNLANGQEDKARRNLWPHGVPPWGYRLERNDRGVSLRPAPVPELAAAVRRLFELGELHGDTVTLDTMRSEGWPAPTAAGWTLKTVANLLTNSNYTGVRVFRGVPVTYEAIISPAQFAAVQRAREERRTHGGAPGTHTLLLTRHVFCAACGVGLLRQVSQGAYVTAGGERKKSAMQVRYQCWKARGRAKVCTNTHPWPVPALDALCWAALRAALTNPARLAQVAAPLPSGPRADLSGRIVNSEAAIERAWRPFADGRAGYSELVAERLAAPHVTELARLRAEAQAEPAPDSRDFRARAAEFRALLADSESQAERRAVLDALSVRFYVGPEGVQRIALEIP